MNRLALALSTLLLAACTEHVPIVLRECGPDESPRYERGVYEPSCVGRTEPKVVVYAPPQVFDEPCTRPDAGLDAGVPLVDVSCPACERWLACLYLDERHIDDAGAPVKLTQPEVCHRYWAGRPPRFDFEDCALCVAGTSCTEFERWDEALCERCPDCLFCV